MTSLRKRLDYTGLLMHLVQISLGFEKGASRTEILRLAGCIKRLNTQDVD